MILLAVYLAALAAVSLLSQRVPGAVGPFADTRSLAGVPNAVDVVSSLSIALAGVAGLRWMSVRADPRNARWSWFVFSVALVLIGLGAAVFHLSPDAGTLFRERLAISVALMSFSAALWSEHLSARSERWVLPLALALGMVATTIWYATGDSRLYAGVHLAALGSIPLVLLLFPAPFTHRWMLVLTLVFYVGSKLVEPWDGEVFILTGEILSGHTLKHLMVACAACTVGLMVRTRRWTDSPPGASRRRAPRA